MLQLPKIERDSKQTEGLCKCRPICKSRRREWKGNILDTSAELLIERKPIPECIKTRPTKVFSNRPCSIHGKGIVIKERYAVYLPRVVRICQAPIHDSVDTPYLRFARMAVRLGAHRAVSSCCPFCPCSPQDYQLDAESAIQRRNDMRKFDTRIKTDHQTMRNMYDKT